LTDLNCDLHLTSGGLSLTDDLNTTIEQQIHLASAKGIDVMAVDPNTAELDGHRLCDSASSWFNGAILPSEFSFHPNADGERYFARIIESKL
jgi:hypothetical protein